MVRRPGIALLTIASWAAFLIACWPAAAQSGVPDVTGTWNGWAQAVQIGPTPYRSAEGDGVIFANRPLQFTYNILHQEGNRFAGELRSGNHQEIVIGALQGDNRGGIMLDDDGRYTFTLRGPDTMDLCYDHLYPSSKVVACWTATRTR